MPCTNDRRLGRPGVTISSKSAPPSRMASPVYANTEARVAGWLTVHGPGRQGQLARGLTDGERAAYRRGHEGGRGAARWGAPMKVCMFHLMPYRDLPSDFEQRYRSAYIDPVWFDVADPDLVGQYYHWTLDE